MLCSTHRSLRPGSQVPPADAPRRKLRREVTGPQLKRGLCLPVDGFRVAPDAGRLSSRSASSWWSDGSW